VTPLPVIMFFKARRIRYVNTVNILFISWLVYLTKFSVLWRLCSVEL